MKTLTKIVVSLCKYVSYCSMAATLIVMVLMTVDVFLRLVFNSPILGSYEIVTMVMSVLIFSSWSYTQTVHGHIHVTMFISKMPHKIRFVLFSFTSLLSTVIMAFVTYASYEYMFKLMGNKTSTSVLMIPHWPFVGLECIAMLLFTFVLLIDAIKSILAIFNDEYAREVSADWT